MVSLLPLCPEPFQPVKYRCQKQRVDSVGVVLRQYSLMSDWPQRGAFQPSVSFRTTVGVRCAMLR